VTCHSSLAIVEVVQLSDQRLAVDTNLNALTLQQ
jgi:hypothetical protein